MVFGHHQASNRVEVSFFGASSAIVCCAGVVKFCESHVGKLSISCVVVGANSKSTFAPKTGYQPLFPSRGSVPGDLAMKFCSFFGTRCLQCWRSFCSGSVAQIWVHITDPNLDPCFYLLIKT